MDNNGGAESTVTSGGGTVRLVGAGSGGTVGGTDNGGPANCTGGGYATYLGSPPTV